MPLPLGWLVQIQAPASRAAGGFELQRAWRRSGLEPVVGIVVLASWVEVCSTRVLEARRRGGHERRCGCCGRCSVLVRLRGEPWGLCQGLLWASPEEL